MPTRLQLLATAAFVSLLPAETLPAQDGPSGSLHAAVQEEDLDATRRLLDAGADPDAPNRYGATALFFAVDRGNLALVRLLLESGASVDVQDSFYEADPLGWSLFSMEDSPEGREIVLLLLGEKPESSDAALGAALRRGDLELARAAWATERIPADRARTLAAGLDREAHPEIATWLESVAGPLDAPPSPETSPEATDAPSPEAVASWAPLVGSYRSEIIDQDLEVRLEGGRLHARLDERSDFVLVPTDAPRRFDVAGIPDLGVDFHAAEGAPVSLELRQGSQAYRFARPGAPTSEPESSDSETGAHSEVPSAAEPSPGAPAPWPSFRGPRASGIADGQAPPATWDLESGENVLWKTPVPGLGLSSPVIHGDRVYLTTAASEGGDTSLKTGLYGDVGSVDDPTEHAFLVLALDLRSGRELWRRELGREVPDVRRHFKSSHANPTPATDGERVVVLFGGLGLFALDPDGEVLWHRELGRMGSGWFFDPSYEWGFAASPILHEGRAIVQVDVYEGSFLAAFDLATGEEVWRTPREEIPTWSTPAVVEGPEGAWEVVTNGPTIRGYDASTGDELWTLGPNSEIVVGTPVVGDGTVFVTGGYPPARPIYAIRPGGRGDLSLADGETSGGPVTWSHQPGGTYMPTPLLYRGVLHMLHNNGRFAAYDAATGELLYRRRIGTNETFTGSPIAADGRIYVTSEEGTTTIVRAGRTFEQLGTSSIDEAVLTTPAVSAGVLVLRGANHVFGLGAPKEETGGAR